ncbi:hypothetical protein LI142_22970 [Eubacterium limosum]|uniref:hypothetical protein n=1 Tax=Eubacterium limosum TaxID=1736 RepID=UPI001D078FD5|nr:hypothetical protein [Eubacterium limosum]MCB6572357.1 hypothetical protein [Eubacterium limosum]
MALAIYLRDLLKALELDLETYLKKHYELFEAVDTGYVAKDGREHLTELIYHGHSGHVCRYCRRALKKKTLRLVEKNGRNHVVNGLSKEVEDADGHLYVLWVCSCECGHCARRQRVLPVFAARWMRHTLFTVAQTLLHLFENDELDAKPLKPRRGRPVLTMPFYGELSTVYRWRQRIKIIFNS